jgi:hypothetical protein
MSVIDGPGCEARDFMDAAPDDVTVYETFMTVPLEPPFLEQLRGKAALAIGIVYAGDGDRDRLVEQRHPLFDPPLRDAGEADVTEAPPPRDRSPRSAERARAHAGRDAPRRDCPSPSSAPGASGSAASACW